VTGPRSSHPVDADRTLDRLLDAASAAPDDEPRQRADFTAVLARAHRIDPGAMPARSLADATRQGTARPVDVDRVLASLVLAARDEADRDVASASAQPARVPASRPRSFRVPTTAALALVAAAALVVFA
jgi:hypothetical protein